MKHNSIICGTVIRLFCLGIIVIIVCSFISCGPNDPYSNYNEDEIAIGEYIAGFKKGVQFTLTGLEKAVYDDNTVYFNVSGTAAYPNGETGDVALIIEYNRQLRTIGLHHWGDFETGIATGVNWGDFEIISTGVKQKWEECGQRQDGIKHYSDEEVTQIREKAEEYAQLVNSLED